MLRLAEVDARCDKICAGGIDYIVPLARPTELAHQYEFKGEGGLASPPEGGSDNDQRRRSRADEQTG